MQDIRVRIIDFGLARVAKSLADDALTAQQVGPDTVAISVDLEQSLGELKPVWAWFGYDEPNYTYMPDGRKLLSQIEAAMPTISPIMPVVRWRRAEPSAGRVALMLRPAMNRFGTSRE